MKYKINQRCVICKAHMFQLLEEDKYTNNYIKTTDNYIEIDATKMLHVCSERCRAELEKQTICGNSGHKFFPHPNSNNTIYREKCGQIND